MKIVFSLIPLLLLNTSSVFAGFTTLNCIGSQYWSENGFGTGSNIKYDASRIVKIDAKLKLIRIETFQGDKVSRQLRITESAYFVFIPHNIKDKGVLIKGENVKIDRFTGEIFSLYSLEGKNLKGQVAFEGICKKAKQKF